MRNRRIIADPIRGDRGQQFRADTLRNPHPDPSPQP
jgi:hypothetical protein